MKNIILITNNESYQFDSIDELKKFLFSNINEFSDDEIEKLLYEKVFGLCVLNNWQIINTKKGVYIGNYEIGNEEKDIDRAIIIDNLDTYILSLCRYNVMLLLEEKDNRYYTKNIDLELEDNNYVVVNTYADKLLKAMVGDSK